MVFSRLLRAFGVGGPSVETVLADAHCRPGGVLTGEVRLAGGDADADITHIALSLVTRVERDEHGGEGSSGVEFFRAVVAGAFRLAAGEHRSIPFQLAVPWETPLTSVFGHHLHGMNLGLRTEVSVAGAVDPGDLDAVSVEPLPAQERVLEAFGQLGFRFKGADLEPGHLHGVHQELPFFQEIEFFAPGEYSGRINEVELTFVASPHELVVVLEADKRGGLFQSGGDAIGRFHLGMDEAGHTDWTRHVREWLDRVVGLRFSGHHEHGYHEHGHHGYDDHHGGGPGIGGVVAGAALGLAGGFVAAEVIDEIGDAFEGDDEDYEYDE
ncbi:sporulation protein [Goodfellowiella coeruleoviolacea]|uniref:Sporulation-control protein n=1 Tax=Goodfellowiella coeruleoviolacea TaxID=334858 RepID=A0AAE3GEG0_9PSEU|nr:sporulation protein [Goodfellowiella coeruleoviolacea]MCP2166781.1 sporulation-control protein [Goodfellowiella coeruleoviolacea]